MPKTAATAEEIRQRILAMIKDAPDGVSTAEIIQDLFGGIKDEDEYRRGAQRVSFNLSVLNKAKRIKKYGGMLGKYRLLDDRPKPEVADIPTRRGRGPNKPKNGAANGDLKSYIIRDIRAKLAELEAL